MSNIDERDDWDAADQQTGGKGDYFTVETGDNKCRILSKPAFIHTHWVDKKPINCVGGDKGCTYCNNTDLDEKESKPKTTFLFYVLDLADDKIKTAEFGASIYNQIREYQKAGEYAYKTDHSPYGITIRKSGSGLGTEYKVIPDRANSDIEQAVLDELAKKKSIKEVRDKMIAKRGTAEAASPASAQDRKDVEDAVNAM